MIVTVFGSTGLMGKEIVKQAIFKDHHVRAYGRNVYTTTYTPSDKLETIKGTLFDDEQVFNALKGADVVLSALGGSSDGNDKTRSLGIKHIISQMKRAGIKRIIAIGGMGILPGDNGKMLMDAEGFPVEYLPVSEEHKTVFEALRDSGLDWTMVAPPVIKDAGPTGDYTVAKDAVPETNNDFINSGDLALFIVNEMERNEYICSLVGISG